MEKEFKVTVKVTGAKETFPSGSEVCSVVGLLSDGMRVPIMSAEGVRYYVDVDPILSTRNNTAYLSPKIDVRVSDPTILSGEGAGNPLILMSAERSIDWNAPKEMKIMESKGLTISLLLEVVETESGEE